MKRSDELKLKRKEKLQRMQAIIDTAKEGDKARALTEDENKEYNTLKGEVESLDSEIENAEFIEKRSIEEPERSNDDNDPAQHQRDGKPNPTPHQRKEPKPYSVGKAMREFATGGASGLTGREKEQHDELARGISDSNGLLVPFNPQEKRSQTTSTNTTTLDTNIDPNLSIIGKEPLYQSMGLTIIPGLQGQFKIGKKQPDEWEKQGETNKITKTANVPTMITMSPERYGITDKFSKELLAQENPAVHAAVIADMVKGGDRKITYEAYAIALAAASEVATGAISVDGFNDLMAAVDLDGSFAMNRASFFEAKGIKVDTGSGRFLATMTGQNGIGRTYDGVNVFFSNLFEDGDAQQYVVYGAWNEIYLGFWGALEILMNPYTYQNEGQIEVTVNRLADLACRNSGAFVKTPDLDSAT